MRIKRGFIFWIGLAFALCWVPSGWLTGLEARLIPASKGHSQGALFWHAAKEPLAHGLLMFGLGFSLMRFLSARQASLEVNTSSRKEGSDQSALNTESMNSNESDPTKVFKINRLLSDRGWLGSTSLSLSGVMMIAVLIEGIQALLPSSFRRGFAWADLEASAVGGLIGILFAVGLLIIVTRIHGNRRAIVGVKL